MMNCTTKLLKKRAERLFFGVFYDMITVMKRYKSCGAVIIDNGKVLLIGAKDDQGKIFWSFPKGHQEDGETDLETAIRETFEEVGLNIKIIDKVPIIRSHYVNNESAEKDIYLFLAQKVGGKIKLQKDEVEYVKWVDTLKVDEYLTDYYRSAWLEIMTRLRRD